MFKRVIFMIFVSILFVACATKVDVPVLEISDAKMALAKADMQGAKDLSSKTFQIANDFYKKIGFYMKKHRYKEATYSAKEAHIIANLAFYRAKNRKLQQKFLKMKSQINGFDKNLETINPLNEKAKGE